MINYIWSLFIIIGIIYSVFKGDTNLSNTLLTSGTSSIDMIFSMGTIICLWLGVMIKNVFLYSLLIPKI